jgi:DNA polymerase III epsilon subunit-like protein
MKVFVFDTETTGLPKIKIINPDTLDLWPHIVQLSFLIYDTEKNDIIKSYDEIVKIPESIIISKEVSNIHGITNKISTKQGKLLHNILEEFFNNLKNVDKIVGHNVLFDINMLKIEILRIIYINPDNLSVDIIKKYKSYFYLLTNYKNISCTLQDSIELCNIQLTNKFGQSYLKFPKLIELHEKLFESIPKNLHNSYNDILITLRCFMKLKYDIDLMKHCKKFKKLIKLLELL